MLTGATFLLVLILAFAQVTAYEQGTVVSQSFRDAFDAYVHHDSIVGAAYVVVDNGRVVEWHSRGMADRDLKQPVDQNTIFHWGSITKTLTAVAVMQLRDRRQLSLESVTVNGREFDTGITTPNGGLNAPLGDLVRWVAFLTGANAAHSPRILFRSSLEEMWRPVMA